MHRSRAPDAIDTALVFRLYSWIAIVGGLWVVSWGGAGYRWPLPPFEEVDLPAIAYGRASLVFIAAVIIVAAGFCAAAFSQVADPVDRRRGLYLFALAHLSAGAFLLFQQSTVWRDHLPLEVGWAPVIAGALLFNLAFSAHGLPRFGDGLLDMLRDPRRRASRVRSGYEEQIRQAAQQEERARLARELHDAVKQQLFVVQTAAATAQARYDTDPAGARAAIAWVRRAGREAMTEMDALLQQLQSPPIENAGLVDALKMLVEALGFRSGADVRLEVGDLPPSDALPPGSQQAVFRAAQEAVSNVARHARARHVDVALEAIGGCLRLTVADDGSGVDSTARAAGMGMRNLRARAEEHGGTLEVTSTPGGGTTVRFSVPYDVSPSRRYGWPALAWGTLAVVGLTLTTTGQRWPPFWILLFIGCLLNAVRYGWAWASVRRSSRGRDQLRPSAGALP